MQFDIVKIPMYINTYIYVQTDLEELKSMKTLNLLTDLSSQTMNLCPLLLSTMMAT